MISKENNHSFQEKFNALNEAQQNAVVSIEGPVLVIAGPGTGKTQILASRIAYILQKTDSLPENILCLTYTDAGAIAMRKRLLEFIGPDSYRVNIFTFHAFCNQIIQENLDYFGLKGLDAISELERIAFVHEIIDSFPHEHPLKRYTGEVYFDADKLIRLYATMKRENWSSSFIEQKAIEYLKDLPNREAFIYKKNTKDAKAGDLKQADIAKEEKRMKELIAAAQSFDTFQQKLRQTKRYDFDDMILWVIQAFKENQDIIRDYQERYHYFLVDEYQDTNGSQNEILNLLIDYWDNPNVFCVGDDDQSIFRFQGANIENIEQYVRKFSPKTITLEANYRSTQDILDASRILIANNKNRVNPNKLLVAKNELIAAQSILPELRSYYNSAHEVVSIANEIIALKESGVKLNEIAVIYRKHIQAEELMVFLQSKKIPINARKELNALNEPFIKRIIQLLHYVEAESKRAHSGEAYIYELLHYSFFKNNPIEIAQISVNVFRKNFNDRNTSWRAEIKANKQQKNPDLFNQNVLQNELGKTSRLLEKWIQDAANVTILQLIENIITESGMLLEALDGNDKVLNMELLHTFFDFVKGECSRKPQTQLTELIETLNLMEKEGIELNLQKVHYAEDGVNFMTAHGSKGLEFEHVFIIGCNLKNWDKAVNNQSYKLPDTIFNLNEVYDLEEYRRLFYVAMTRAKKHLVISYANKDLNNKDLEKSRFVAELEEHKQLTTTHIHSTSEELIEFENTLRQFSQIELDKDLFNNPFVDELLEKYTLSVTHLNNYLKCATAFYFNNLIRVPAPLSANMTFGSAVHHALEVLFKNMNLHPNKEFASSQQFVNDFKWYLRKHEASFTNVEFKRRIAYGEHILPLYYEKYIHEWNKITSIERSYRNIVMQGVPLNGKLDKLEFAGNKVNVVDYKTGQFENAKHKFSPPNAALWESKKNSNDEKLFEYEFGGDYWRQAVFYKILMDYDVTNNWEVQSTEFDFVEPDKKTGNYMKQKVTIAASDIEIVKSQILTSYAGIKAKEFNKGCGKKECEWCTFVKEYYSGNRDLLIPIIAGEED